ncbi:MAG: FliM/FliN family flagellar motor switch protein [Aquabacterium sp.]
MNTETQAIDLPTLVEEAPSGQPLFAAQAALPFLGNLKVRLTAQLGATQLSVADLTALQKGATVKLDRLLDQPIDLLAEGHVVAQGTLVAVGDHFGLRITSTPKLA